MFDKAKKMFDSIKRGFSNFFNEIKEDIKYVGAKISKATSDIAGWWQQKRKVWNAPEGNPHLDKSSSEIAQIKRQENESSFFGRLFSKKPSNELAALEDLFSPKNMAEAKFKGPVNLGLNDSYAVPTIGGVGKTVPRRNQVREENVDDIRRFMNQMS